MTFPFAVEDSAVGLNWSANMRFGRNIPTDTGRDPSKRDPAVRKHSRREIVVGIAAAAGLASFSAKTMPLGWEKSVEEQRGDVDAPFEAIEIDPKSIFLLSQGQTRAAFEPRLLKFPETVASVAQRFVNKTRETDKSLISEMLKLFNLPFEDEHTRKPIPFCASGLAYVVALSYLETRNASKTLSAMQGVLADIDHYHFFPSPSVWDMYYVALGKRRWVPVSERQPVGGWVVLYDFGKGADHVGLVLEADGKRLRTFECNTSGNIGGDNRNGGAIAEKIRDYSRVKGYIRTDLDMPA